MKPKTLYVFLGRFSPIHKGHQMIVDKMINKFGIKNCLIIIGSSTSLNKRTPFTYAARRKMIRILYPNLKIVGFPDTKPNLLRFSINNIDTWLKKLKFLAKKMNARFVFCSGNDKDIGYLKDKFEIKILIQRVGVGRNISATKIRENLVNYRHASLQNLLDERVMDLAIKQYGRFLKSSI